MSDKYVNFRSDERENRKVDNSLFMISKSVIYSHGSVVFIELNIFKLQFFEVTKSHAYVLRISTSGVLVGRGGWEI